MSVFELEDTQKDAWDSFVHSCEGASFFHLSGWRDVLEQAFGCRTFYLYQKSGGAISGVLPLALLKRPIFGPALISTPLCVYGGAIGDTNDLEDYAAQKARELGVQYLELRNATKTREDWPVSDFFATFRKALSESHDDNLKGIPRKQRAEVRKGIAADLNVSISRDFDLFYQVYAASVHGLGTPVFAKRYLQVLMHVFGDSCFVSNVNKDGRPLSSVLSFRYKDQVLPYYGGGLAAARDYSAYPFMYWKVMEYAVDEGLRVFDFGRSMKGSGAYAFKKNFGFEAEPLSYQYHLVKADDIPVMDADSPRNKMLVSCWKKMPLWAANKVGPAVYPVVM